MIIGSSRSLKVYDYPFMMARNIANANYEIISADVPDSLGWETYVKEKTQSKQIK